MPLVLDALACCDVCMEEYNGDLPAYALNCGHSLCKDCTSTLSPLSCPMCRQTFRRSEAIKLHADYSGPVASSSNLSGKQRKNSLDEGQLLLERITWAFDDPHTDTTIFDDVREYIVKEGDETEPAKTLRIAINTLERYRSVRKDNEENQADASLHEAIAASLNHRLNEETEALRVAQGDLDTERQMKAEFLRQIAQRDLHIAEEHERKIATMRNNFASEMEAIRIAEDDRLRADQSASQQLRDQLHHQRATIDGLRDEISAVKAAAAMAEDNRRSRKDDIIARLRTQLTEVTESSQILREENVALTTKVAETSAEAKRSRQQDIIDGLRRKNQQQLDMIVGHEAEMASARSRVDDLKSEITQLRHEMSQMQAEAARQTSASHDMEAHLLGRMEEEVAASNALKRQLTSIRSQPVSHAMTPVPGSSVVSEVNDNLAHDIAHMLHLPSSPTQVDRRPSPGNPFSRSTHHTRAVTEISIPVIQHVSSRSYDDGIGQATNARAQALLDTVASETRNEPQSPYLRFNPPKFTETDQLPSTWNPAMSRPLIPRDSQSYTDFAQPPHLRYDEDGEHPDSPFSSKYATTSNTASLARVDPMTTYLRPFDHSAKRLFSDPGSRTPANETASPTSSGFSEAIRHEDDASLVRKPFTLRGVRSMFNVAE